MKRIIFYLLIPFVIPIDGVWSVSPVEKGCALHLEGRYSEALRFYSQALTDPMFDEDVPRTMYYSALCYQQIGNFDMALKALWQLVGDYPGSDVADEAYLELAKLRERQGKEHFGEALVLYETVLSRYPRSPRIADAFMGAARVKVGLGYQQYADQNVQNVIERSGSFEETASIHYEIALIYANALNPKRNIRAAMDHLDIVTRRFWGSDIICDTLLLKAKLYWELGNLSEAMQLYREVTVQFSGSPASEYAQENIARLYEELGDLQRAVNAYRILQVKYSFSDMTRQRLQTQIDRFTDSSKLLDKPTISAWTASEKPDLQTVHYEGDVEIRLGKALIHADKAEVDYKNGSISAAGNVQIRWNDQIVVHAQTIRTRFTESYIRCSDDIEVHVKETDGIKVVKYAAIRLSLQDGTISSEGN